MTDFTGSFGSPTAVRAPAAAVLLVLAMLASPAASAGEPSEPRSLESLMAAFASMPGLSARFREEKRMTLLREPLTSRGAIYFAPPDRLARWVEEPVPSRLLLDGSGLAYSGDGRSGRLDVGQHPTMGQFVDSLRMILGGDLAGLRELYEIEYEAGVGGDPEAWRARLVPRRESLGRFLAELRIRGRGVSVSRFQIRERGGDTTDMQFSEVDGARHFDPEELALRFGMPGS
ncbi:MAG: LolA family protein [Myxococcota bacterium]